MKSNRRKILFILGWPSTCKHGKIPQNFFAVQGLNIRLIAQILANLLSETLSYLPSVTSKVPRTGLSVCLSNQTLFFVNTLDWKKQLDLVHMILFDFCHAIIKTSSFFLFFYWRHSREIMHNFQFHQPVNSASDWLLFWAINQITARVMIFLWKDYYKQLLVHSKLVFPLRKEILF